MYVVHGTKKFLQRVGEPVVTPSEPSTTALGDWYATVLFWRPQVALFVNERTLLPFLMPLAPASTVLERFPAALADLLLAHRVDAGFVADEVAAMAERQLAKTANRSVVGSMNEFGFLAEDHADDTPDLVALSLRLAQTPCGPLYSRHVSPDRELAALVSG